MGATEEEKRQIRRYAEEYEIRVKRERERQAAIDRRDKPMLDAIAKAAAEVRAIRGKR